LWYHAPRRKDVAPAKGVATEDGAFQVSSERGKRLTTWFFASFKPNITFLPNGLGVARFDDTGKEGYADGADSSSQL